jgi:hypothetical protein
MPRIAPVVWFGFETMIAKNNDSSRTRKRIPKRNSTAKRRS